MLVDSSYWVSRRCLAYKPILLFALPQRKLLFRISVAVALTFKMVSIFNPGTVLSTSSSCTQIGYTGRFCVCLICCLSQEQRECLFGVFSLLKSSGLHFGVKVLMKPFYKSNHLAMGSVKYICFSLDFSCIMRFFNQRFFFKEPEGCKCPNPGNQYYIVFHADPCTSNRALQQDTGITKGCVWICVSCQCKGCQRAVSFLPGHGRCIVL